MKNKILIIGAILALVVIGLVYFYYEKSNEPYNDVLQNPRECDYNLDNFCTEENCEYSGGTWGIVNGLSGGGICVCPEDSIGWTDGFGCDYNVEILK